MSWRIGVSTACSLHHPILAALAEIHRAGIAGIEISTPAGHFDPGEVREVAGLHDQIVAAGIEPVSIHAPFGGLLDLSDPNPHHRHAAIGAILTAASALRTLGGQIVVVHTTDTPRDGQNLDERLHHCATSLSSLSRSCQEMNVRLAIESPLPHLIGGAPDEFAHILEHTHPPAGVCLDTSHVTLGHHWSRFVEIAAGRLIHVHANDHRGQYDEHLPPGDGIIDWRQVGADLRRLDYQGWIILELHCAGGPSADGFIRAGRQLLERTA